MRSAARGPDLAIQRQHEHRQRHDGEGQERDRRDQQVVARGRRRGQRHQRRQRREAEGACDQQPRRSLGACAEAVARQPARAPGAGQREVDGEGGEQRGRGEARRARRHAAREPRRQPGLDADQEPRAHRPEAVRNGRSIAQLGNRRRQQDAGDDESEDRHHAPPLRHSARDPSSDCRYIRRTMPNSRTFTYDVALVWEDGRASRATAGARPAIGVAPPEDFPFGDADRVEPRAPVPRLALARARCSRSSRTRPTARSTSSPTRRT